MKLMNKIIAAALIAFMCIPFGAGLAAADDNAADYSDAEAKQTLKISTASEFMEFADECILDSYSVGLTVELTADISLKGVDFNGIASFSGTFSGGEHTISDVNIERNGTGTGFFRNVTEGALIEGLNIEGKITAGGTGENAGGLAGINNGTISKCSFDGEVQALKGVGGICGTNGQTGVITACVFSGSISGEHQVGGICGENNGNIILCENNAQVNSEAKATTVSDSEITAIGISDVFNKLTELENDDILNITDIGGICGANNNLVYDCKNEGTVGYIHIGYNVGGIVGQNSGYVNNCKNNGDVYGRNDVGGIVGQLNPYAVWDLSESNITKLAQLFDTLNGQMETISYEAGTSIGSLSGSISTLVSNTTEATAAFTDIVSQCQDNVDNTKQVIQNSIKQISEAAKFGFDFNEVDRENFDLDDVNFKVVDVGTIRSELQHVSDTVQGIVPDTSRLTSAMESLSYSLSNAMGSLSGSGSLLDSISAAMNTVSQIMDTGLVTADNVGLSEDYMEDVSVADPYAQDTGAIANCSENATVNGDTGVGGIVGTVDFEISFDLEGELGISDYLFGNARYNVFAAVRDCQSEAEIVLKKENAGGIAGSENFGVIINCVAYGKLPSDDGAYIGGIAGKSSGTVISSYSRTNICGEKYIGGICGSGKNVTDSVSYSTIDSGSELVGAICGSADGTLQNNYYVGERIGGVDGVDLDGKAVHIGYDEMTESQEIPEEFKKIEITFEDENGDTVKKINVEYGGSIEAKDIPVVEGMDGYYWAWDEFDKENICYSQKVGGSWKKNITSISAENGNIIFLAEGSFNDAQELVVESVDEEIEAPAGSRGCTLVGVYNIEITDFEGGSLIRMKGTDLKVWAVSEGGYSELQCSEDGSYTMFALETPAKIVVFAENTANQFPVWIIVVAAVVVAGVIALIIILRKKARSDN